jgi:hypothetical protein
MQLPGAFALASSFSAALVVLAAGITWGPVAVRAVPAPASAPAPAPGVFNGHKIEAITLGFKLEASGHGHPPSDWIVAWIARQCGGYFYRLARAGRPEPVRR